MFGKGKVSLVKKSQKNAEITIEIALSLALVLVVLFLVLSLFSNNLQAIAKNSGIFKFFNTKNEVSKTFSSSSADYKNTDPTKTQINVQVVADQGLDYYLTQANSTIDKYKDESNLTQSQIEDLAKAITELSYYNGSSANYSELRSKYGIKISLSNITGLSTTTVSDSSGSAIASFDYKKPLSSTTDSVKLATIKSIDRASYK